MQLLDGFGSYICCWVYVHYSWDVNEMTIYKIIEAGFSSKGRIN